MGGVDIYDRVFRFVCRIVRMDRALTPARGGRPLMNQLLRASTSIGANLEEARAAQTKADFNARFRISLKEAREALYWLRLLEECEIVGRKRIHPLVQEADEIVAIMTAIAKKATSPRPLLSSSFFIPHSSFPSMSALHEPRFSRFLMCLGRLRTCLRASEPPPLRVKHHLREAAMRARLGGGSVLPRN
jgi:four helix bundle protein